MGGGGKTEGENEVADHDTLLKAALDLTKNYFQSFISPEIIAALPPLRRSGEWRSWGPPGIIGVFYQTMDGKQLARNFEERGLGPYPGLITTDPKGPVAIEISGTLGLFASNRIEGRAFRVAPASSFALWQHAQVFRERLGKHVVYQVPLAFILGEKPEETELEVEERIQQLIDHTIKVWRDLQGGA
jgi:hypothetical protein